MLKNMFLKKKSEKKGNVSEKIEKIAKFRIYKK